MSDSQKRKFDAQTILYLSLKPRSAERKKEKADPGTPVTFVLDEEPTEEEKTEMVTRLIDRVKKL